MAKIKVCIDPGHGGDDRANRGPTGYIEADGVLKISLYLRDLLLKNGNFDVKLTREKDMTLGLTERAMIAANFGADMFLCEHTNAGGGRGSAVYESVDSPDDKLADEMATAISSALGIPNRGGMDRESEKYPGEDYYTIIDVAQDHGVKHILLIESAFHDSVYEEKLLKNDTYIKAIAKAQFDTICNYYKDSIKKELRIRVNGKFIAPTVKPFIKGGYTMVPVRDIAEALGKKVYWDPKSLIVDIK